MDKRPIFYGQNKYDVPCGQAWKSTIDTDESPNAARACTSPEMRLLTSTSKHTFRQIYEQVHPWCGTSHCKLSTSTYNFSTVQPLEASPSSSTHHPPCCTNEADVEGILPCSGSPWIGLYNQAPPRRYALLFSSSNAESSSTPPCSY